MWNWTTVQMAVRSTLVRLNVNYENKFVLLSLTAFHVHQPHICETVCVSPTGPKGVINDWRKYKQLENEQRVEQQKEMERLIKKLSMTCKSHLEEEADRQKQKELQDKIAGKVRNTLYTSQHTECHRISRYSGYCHYSFY